MRSDRRSDHDHQSRTAVPWRAADLLDFGLPFSEPDEDEQGRDDSAESREPESLLDSRNPDWDDLEEGMSDEEDEEEEEALGETIESEPRTILITGACGNLGRKLRTAWEEVYELVLIDVAVGDDEDDQDVIQADLSELDDDWITHFHGVDTVVHLAANPDESAPWDELIKPNLDALANVFHAAEVGGQAV